MRIIRVGTVAALLGAASLAAAPSAPEPKLSYAFTARVTVASALEQGVIDGKRTRFIPITGGTVDGPRLTGIVLAGGGDWQTIGAGGLTEVRARYFIKASDGTIISVENAGVRTAPPDVIDRLAKGEDVDPSLYYFRTTPTFEVSGGTHDWLRRQIFVARGVRKPDHVMIDVYTVE